MQQDILEAFEAAVHKGRESAFGPIQSDKSIRRAAVLLMKQVETVLENLPDQSMTVRELYEEIAGMAWRG